MGLIIDGTVQHSKGPEANLGNLKTLLNNDNALEGALAVIEMAGGKVELRIGDEASDSFKDPLAGVKEQIATINQTLNLKLTTDDDGHNDLQEILDYIEQVEAAITSGNAVVTWSSVTGKPNLDALYLGINANAVSASKLKTARTITLTGGVSGSVSFDGSGNASMNTALNVDGIKAPAF